MALHFRIVIIEASFLYNDMIMHNSKRHAGIVCAEKIKICIKNNLTLYKRHDIFFKYVENKAEFHSHLSAYNATQVDISQQADLQRSGNAQR